MIPILGLIAGLVIGLLWSTSIPLAWSPYVAVLILASIDALVGGTAAHLRGRFNTTLFLSGLAVNAGAAFLLTLLGEQIHFQMSLVAVFAFGTRIFQNLAVIRRQMLRKFLKRREEGWTDDDLQD
jgi:small basic protein